MAGAPGRPVVVKVGGSLYDLPDLGPRLRRWLSVLDTTEVLLLPGGGPTADAVRAFDRCQRLGDEAAHWLALRALSLNAHFLAGLLSGCVVDAWQACPAVWGCGKVPVLDAHAFAAADERTAGALPHRWDVTSDSVAARVADVGAARLILLKSVTLPEGLTWTEAGEGGFVDRYFGRALGPACEVSVINFRNQS